MSFAETFLARGQALLGHRDAALARIEQAIDAYQNRDVFCRFRLMLERARLLMSSDPQEAIRTAGFVRARAAEMGAKPLVQKADAILDRLM